MSLHNLESWANSKTAAGANSTSGQVPTSNGSGALTWQTPAAGGAGGGIALNWAFSTTTADADPGANTFRMNNATPASVTEIYVDDLANSGVDASTVLESLNAGDKIYIQQLDTAANFILLTVVSVTDATGYYRIVVTVDDSGTLFGDTEDCGFILQYAAANAATGINDDVACKGWVNFTADSPFGINASFNVSSVDDNGTGSYDVNWDIDFDDADYSVNVGVQDSVGTSTHGVVDNATLPTASTVRIGTVRTENASSIDPDNVFVQAFGNMSNLSTGGNTFAVNKSSLCKGWVNFDSSPTVVILSSFNVDSVDDNATGDYDVNWDQDFDDINYSVTYTSGFSENAVTTLTTSDVRVQSLGSTGTPGDSNNNCVQAFGNNSVTGLTGDASFDAIKIEGETIDGGVAVGDPAYFDGTDWKASTGSATYPSGVKDGTTGQIVEAGIATGLSGLTAGTLYWLASATGLTTDKTDTGIFIGRAHSTTSLIVQINDNTSTGVNPDAAAKAWVEFDGTGVIAINKSFNVASIDDNATGDYDVNWDIDFDDADYPVSLGVDNGPNNISYESKAVGSINLDVRDVNNTSQDASSVSVIAFGDNPVTVGGAAPGVKVDSLVKAWLDLNGSGTIAIDGSFNVDSVDDNGTGNYFANFAVPFDDADYSVAVSAAFSVTAGYGNGTGGKTTAGCSIGTGNMSGTPVDSSTTSMHCYGNNPVALSTEPDSSSLIKAWLTFDGTGAISINKSFNVDTVDDDGTGLYSVNWAVAFSDADYCIAMGVESAGQCGVNGAAGKSTIDVDIATTNASGTLTDLNEISLQVTH